MTPSAATLLASLAELLGIGLLGINLIGLWSASRQRGAADRAPSSEAAPAGAGKEAKEETGAPMGIGGNATRYPRSIAAMLGRLPSPAASQPEPFCLRLNELLQQRFAHGYGRHTLWSNYLCRLAGLWAPHARDIHTTTDLLRHSRHALCGQAAQAFVDLATRAGLAARIVALEGHVVAEARYAGNWHGFDPDYGVAYAGPDGTIESVRRVADDPELARYVYRRHRLPRDNREVLDILARRTITCLPAGAHAVPRIARLQRVLAWLKWLLPAILLLAAPLLAWKIA